MATEQLLTVVYETSGDSMRHEAGETDSQQ